MAEPRKRKPREIDGKGYAAGDSCDEAIIVAAWPRPVLCDRFGPHDEHRAGLALHPPYRDGDAMRADAVLWLKWRLEIAGDPEPDDFDLWEAEGLSGD